MLIVADAAERALAEANATPDWNWDPRRGPRGAAVEELYREKVRMLDAQREELDRLREAQAYHALAIRRLREAGARVPPAA